MRASTIDFVMMILEKSDESGHVNVSKKTKTMQWSDVRSGMKIDKKSQKYYE
jgi:hypothetical protein